MLQSNIKEKTVAVTRSIGLAKTDQWKKDHEDDHNLKSFRKLEETYSWHTAPSYALQVLGMQLIIKKKAWQR